MLAELISDRIECDRYRIDPSRPYPDAYDATVERNVEEERADVRPAIADPLPDVDAYDIVLLGSPVWNEQAPMIMFTFIEGIDLSGKMILPFVTYAVSGIGRVEDDYRAALVNSDVRPGLAVLGETVADAGAYVERWLRANRLT
ncbi:MAG: NAD(P)H-dependent oxidoreductase [Actinomycetota bacterium]|nr:NAD(P)H-dependent oxidoreductase [Actinomycetota bacterium]